MDQKKALDVLGVRRRSSDKSKPRPLAKPIYLPSACRPTEGLKKKRLCFKSTEKHRRYTPDEYKLEHLMTDYSCRNGACSCAWVERSTRLTGFSVRAAATRNSASDDHDPDDYRYDS